jgi:hypothetical protein
MEGDTDGGSVIHRWSAWLQGGVTGLHTRFGVSIVNDGLGVAPSQKERGHLDTASVEITNVRAESSKPQKLREGDSTLGSRRVGRVIMHVCMGSCLLVVDSRGEHPPSDGERKVQEVHAGGGHCEGELDGRVKVLDKLYERVKVFRRQRGDAEPIIDVTSIELRNGACVYLSYLVLQVPHAQARITGAHFCAHSYATGLVVVLTINLKGIEGQHKFGQANEGVSGWEAIVGGTAVQKVLKGSEPVCMGNGRV